MLAVDSLTALDSSMRLPVALVLQSCTLQHQASWCMRRFQMCTQDRVARGNCSEVHQALESSLWLYINLCLV